MPLEFQKRKKPWERELREAKDQSGVKRRRPFDSSSQVLSLVPHHLLSWRLEKGNQPSTEREPQKWWQMQTQEVEREHSGFASSRNAVAACLLLELWKVCQHFWSRFGRGDWETRSLFPVPFCCCDEANVAFPRLTCQSNTKYTGALLIIPPAERFSLGVLL